MLLVLASVGVAVSLLAAITTARDSHREAGLQAERLTATAEVIAALSGEAAAAGDRTRAFAAIRAIGAMPEVVYARIEGADGRLLAETGAGVRLTRDAQASAERRASILAALQSRTLEVSAPILYARDEVGRVVVLGRLDGAARRLASSLLAGLLAAIAATAVGFAVAWRLQRRIAGPILSLTRAMGEVRAGRDYEHGAQIVADDEVAELVDGFNAMLAEIRARDRAIADHMAGLERTIAERTADLRTAKEAADAANSAKSDFLATMSHEIRTPMNGIMVMAEMLAAGELPPRQRRFADVIAKSGQSLLAIINDILDFSKIEAGKMELEATPTDPAEVVEDVCSLFWEQASAKGLELAAFVDPDLPKLISADPVRLRQVIGNLVNNAIKFTETGGVLVEAGLTEDGRIRIAVQDTGVGIAKPKLAALFSAFTQADQSTTRRFGGTGLGLAICKRLVEAMDGEVFVDSELGCGSVFGFEAPITVLQPAEPLRLDGDVELRVAGAFTRRVVARYAQGVGLNVHAEGEGPPAALIVTDPASAPVPAAKSGVVLCICAYGDPAAAELQRAGRIDAVLVQPLRRRDLALAFSAWRAGQPVAEALEVQPRADLAQLPSFAGRKVLVADDSAVNREVALEALTRLGATCAMACDGAEALEAAFRDDHDLILMDGSMPRMDGYEAARQIRGRETELDRPRVPIIALTAHVVGEAAQAWRDAGMDGVLHKPFTLSGLAQTLARFVEPSGVGLVGPEPAAADPSAPVADSDLLDPVISAELAALAASGRGDFFDRIRKLYKDNAPEAARRILDAVAAGDLAEAASAAHALKSMSLNIGARAVADLTAVIEAQARDAGSVEPTLPAALYETLQATLRALHGAHPAVQAAPAPPASDPDQALLDDLVGAAERDELRLVYQRQVERDGHRIVGLEALIRWRHPVRGEVSPAIFIPLAERHGLIRPITRWVVERAIEETEDLEGVSVSINASAVEFGDASFVDDLALLAARHRFDPGRLEIEITETAILADGEDVRQNIARLQALGVKIALDDFGVGYSSLSHLRTFPFDKLKIDRAFINDCAEDVQAATLVHAVVSVGRALGMQVVAEGVETEAQHKFLKLAGVHILQGYFFGRPEPIEALRPILGGSSRAPAFGAAPSP